MKRHRKPKARGGGKPHGLEAQQAFERQSAAALRCYPTLTPAKRQARGAAGPIGRLIDQCLAREDYHRRHLVAALAIRRELEALAFPEDGRP